MLRRYTTGSSRGATPIHSYLSVSNLAKGNLFVQAKRYKLGSKVSANAVRQLRQAIPQPGFVRT